MSWFKTCTIFKYTFIKMVVKEVCSGITKQGLFSCISILPQYKMTITTVALNELKNQVYFSWQLQSVLGNMKLLFRINTISFQALKLLY